MKLITTIRITITFLYVTPFIFSHEIKVQQDPFSKRIHDCSAFLKGKFISSTSENLYRFEVEENISKKHKLALSNNINVWVKIYLPNNKLDENGEEMISFDASPPNTMKFSETCLIFVSKYRKDSQLYVLNSDSTSIYYISENPDIIQDTLNCLNSSTENDFSIDQKYESHKNIKRKYSKITHAYLKYKEGEISKHDLLEMLKDEDIQSLLQQLRGQSKKESSE